jgi:signal transduction histidine kinase
MKRLEAETLRAAQLASLGELAASVAHEINNPINGIINYAQIMHDRPGDEALVADAAARIIAEGERIAQIVRSLLSYSRSEKKAPGPVDLRQLVDETLYLTGIQLRKEGIYLELDIPEDTPLVRARPQELKQVFLNIISNARQALNLKYPGEDPNKMLAIRVDKVKTVDGGRVALGFVDHGPGIPPEDITRVCDPFFTTKPESRGTGLGLSISFQILQDLGGALHFESKPGEYTRVVVELPVWGE